MSSEFAVIYGDFSLGVNDTASLDLLPPNHVYNAKNIKFDVTGAITTRPNLTTIYSLPELIKEIFPYRSNRSTGFAYNMTYAGNSLYKDTQNIYSVQNKINSAVTFWSPTSQKDIFIFNDGDTLKKYDNSTVTTLTSNVKGKYLAVSDFRVWTAGADEYPDYIFMSSVGDPDTWDPNRGLRIATWQGDRILNILLFLDKLYVFFNHSIWAITGDVLEDFTILPIISEIGIYDDTSVHTNGNHLAFVSYNKVAYLFDGRSLQDISTGRVDNHFKNSTKFYTQVFDNIVYFLLDSELLVYNISKDLWEVHDIVGNCVSVINNEVVIGQDTNVTKFNGSNVSVQFSLKPFGIDNPLSMKKFKLLAITCSSNNNVTIEYYTDDNIIQNIAFKPSNKTEIIKLQDVKGRILYVTIKGTDLTFNNIAVYGKVKKPR